jgi:hypothetical protein
MNYRIDVPMDEVREMLEIAVLPSLPAIPTVSSPSGARGQVNLEEAKRLKKELLEWDQVCVVDEP